MGAGKKRFWFLFWMGFLFMTDTASAGGAAAGGPKRQQAQMQQQMQIQQQLIMQKAVQMRMKQKMQEKVQQKVAQEAVSAAVQSAAQASAQGAVQLEGDVRAELLLRQKAELSAQKAGAVASFDEVIRSLNRSARDWTLMIDASAKETVVSYYIDLYRRRGIQIRKPAEYYAQMIDGISAENSTMLEPPFEQVMRVVATIEYDFENGQDKDALAQKILGSQESVMKNRIRLGLPTGR